MTAIRRQRIVIAGAGIAGAILTAALRSDSRREIVCLERSLLGEQEGAGTGLNIGPNAVKALRAYRPETAARLERHSLPWREWWIALTDGRELMRLDLRDVADNDGLRLRWSELYRLLREPVRERIRFGHEVVSARYAEGGEEGPLVVEIHDRATGAQQRITGVDLLIGADGRFSRVRRSFVAPTAPRHLGVANFRLLIPRDPTGAIDDYVQYFNGPNRLLAFRVPDGAVYLSASFPIEPGAPVADGQKTPEALWTLYRPASGELCRDCRFLLDAIQDLPADIHWSRLHDEPAFYDDERGHVLLLGDAAHPMVPTLGQGATQTVEDACVAQEELNAADRLTDAIAAIVARRARRLAAVATLSWEASSMMLKGADPAAGTRHMLEASFRDRLASVYRDAPRPRPPAIA
jgi:2-polyprenyl-6-methoxyphenol hydroxylase-like FAD-dependent oxidoreductase